MEKPFRLSYCECVGSEPVVHGVAHWLKRRHNPAKTSRVLMNRWWDARELNQGECCHYTIGPCSIFLQRQHDAWLLAWQGEPESVDHEKVFNDNPGGIPAELVPSRYVFQRSPARFQLRPRLLDRPVVVRTTQPVSIPPDEKITFFISSPLCIEILLGNASEPFAEITSVRLSDTWFGPSTREGDLCYAAQTRARNNREDVPVRPHRAVTPVTLHNRSEKSLAINALSIPVPCLSVCAESDGSLWTEPISLEHTDQSALANFRIGKLSADGERLALARQTAAKSGVVRAVMNMMNT